MNTYTAQIIYRIECEGVKTEQYDEQWRLVMAENENEALTTARNIAKNEEATFADRHGRIVRWKFIAVKDLQKVELGNGTLLFSQVKEVTPVTAPVWASAEAETKPCYH